MNLALEQITVQKITQHDLATLLGWAATEGWNPGKHDRDVFWNTDPDGFYGCFHDNELIAGGAIIKHDEAFGFMGLFIVHSEYRSHGIGHKLWHARKNLLLSRLNANATIGMDGILAMQPYYQKGGFEIAFRDERYELMGQAYDNSPHVSAIAPDDHAAIGLYDTRMIGYQRSAFLHQWLTMPESKAIQYKHRDELMGYAVMRRAEMGYRIGPLFAQNETVAEELLKSCLSHAPGDSVYLDIPTVNEQAMHLAKKFDGRYVFECARMYCGEAPKANTDQTFGITTFELG